MADTTKSMDILVRLRNEASASLKLLNKQIGDVDKQASIAERTLAKVRNRLFDLKSAVFGLQGLFVGLGIALTGRSFLEAATSAENYRLRLNALLGSVEEGNRMFQEMSKFAAQVPFSYEEIMGAATQLSGVMKGGIEEIKQWMPIIADLAAVAGLDIQTTTQQIVRMYSAGAASADLFRERGITAMLGFQAGVSYSAEKTKEQIIKAWEDPRSKFKGATKDMAKSWDGMMSMIGDKWFQFRNLVMDAGVFDALKSALSDINERFGKWIEQNKTLIGVKVPEYVETIKNFMVEFLKTAKEVNSLTLGVGLVGFILYGKKAIGLIALLAYTSKKIKELRSDMKDLKKEAEEKTGRERTWWEGILPDPGMMDKLKRDSQIGGGQTLLEWLGFVPRKTGDEVQDLKNQIDFLTEDIKKQKESLAKTPSWLQSTGTYKGDVKYIQQLEDALDGLKKKLNDIMDNRPVFAPDFDEEQAADVANKIQKWISDVESKGYDPHAIAEKNIEKMLQAELKALKFSTASYLSELDFRYDQGEVKANEYYDARIRKIKESSNAELKILKDLAEKAPKEKKFEAQQKIIDKEKETTKAIVEEERKRTKALSAEDEKRVSRAIALAEKITDIELQNLDDLYKEKSTKDADYYNKRWEIIKKSFDNEIKLLEERKKTASTKDIEGIDQQIADKRIETYKKLTEVARNYFEERKKIDELIMSQRGSMLGAFTENIEDFKSVQDEWWQYQSNQLAVQYNKYKEFYQNDELANKWLAERKSQLLDEWLQKSNFAYSQLKNLSQRTAEAIEQSFSDFFFNIAKGKFENLKDVGAQALDTLLKISTDMMGQITKKLFTDQMEKVFKKFASDAYDAKASLAGIDQEIVRVGALTKAYFGLAAAKAMAGFAAGLSGYAPTGAGVASGYQGYTIPTPTAEGGLIPGSSPHPKADNILLAATAGEFMQPVDAVRYYGKQAMEAIRQKAIPREIFSSFRIPRISSPPSRRFAYAGGGSVGGGGLKVEIENKNPTPSQVTDASYDPRRQVISLVLDAVDKNVDGAGVTLSSLLSRRQG